MEKCTMNESQRERYEMRLAQYRAINDLTPGMESIIWTLACVEIEEQTLQQFCNDHGTTYDVQGVGGDIYSRARPQWQQLREARMRKQALVARIEQSIKGHDEKIDTAAEFFS